MTDILQLDSIWYIRIKGIRRIVGEATCKRGACWAVLCDAVLCLEEDSPSPSPLPCKPHSSTAKQWVQRSNVRRKPSRSNLHSSNIRCQTFVATNVVGLAAADIRRTLVEGYSSRSRSRRKSTILSIYKYMLIRPVIYLIYWR
jgi:hypothetical protein